MAADAEDSPELDVQDLRRWWEQGQCSKAPEGRSRVWTLTATMLMIAGLVPIVGLALRGDGSRPPKEAPAAAAVDGSAGGEPPGREGTAAPGGALASARSPEMKPVRTVAVRPDGSPVAAPASTESSASGESPGPPAGSEPAPANETARTGRAVKPDSPAKHPARSPSGAVAVTRDATGPAMAPGPGARATPPATPARADGATNEPRPPQAATDTIPASFDRMLHAIGGLLGARSPPVDLPGATPASTGWAVQLAAPRSEAEARIALARISARHASTLRGSKVGVRKAVVDGVTVYRLRVVDLSRADASILCERLKGDGGDCFVAR